MLFTAIYLTLCMQDCHQTSRLILYLGVLCFTERASIRNKSQIRGKLFLVLVKKDTLPTARD